MNVAELLTIPASMFPEQELLRFEGMYLTYDALADRVGRMAGALRALGVGPGQRVAVLQTNTPAVVEALYATASIGAEFVPLHFRAGADELSYMLNVARPSVLLAGDRYVQTAAALDYLAGGRAQLLSIESKAPNTAHLADLAAITEPAFPEDVPDEHVAALLFTSGTTAAAKAVMLPHASLTGFVFGTTEPADGSDRGAVLLAAPLYHVAGLTAVLTATFAGRRIVLMRQFEAGEWLRLVEAERVTHAFLVPTMLKKVLEHPAFGATDLASLQVLSYGAAPMPLGLIRRAIATFPPTVQFINAFGQTETTSTVTMLGPDDHRLDGTPEEVERKLRRLGSVGKPLPDVEIRILDENGSPLPSGQVGEIAIRTERAARGYHAAGGIADPRKDDGWLRTRDLGWLDEDGYLFLAGRQSDMIIRGGENIAPEEVEAVLETHPAVEEAAVFGVPDEEWGERVAAFVVVREEIGTETLVEFCRQRLASYKKPEIVMFGESVPRNALGKVLRKDLRARYARVPVGGA